MKTIHLPRLGLDFLAHDNFYFHDDGVVNNLEEHTAYITGRYELPIHLPWWERYSREQQVIPEVNGIMGRYQGIFKGVGSVAEAILKETTLCFHIYVRAGMSREMTIFSHGHEEAHVLHKIGKIDVLKKGLANNSIDSRDLEDLPTEAICDIGGVHSILRAYPNSRHVKFNSLETGYISLVSEWLKERSDVVVVPARRRLVIISSRRGALYLLERSNEAWQDHR